MYSEARYRVSLRLLSEGSLVHSFLQHGYAVDDAYKATVETAALFGERVREIPSEK